VVSFLLTPGNIHDSKPSIELALQIDLKDVIMLADKAYNTQLFRNVLLKFVMSLPTRPNSFFAYCCVVCRQSYPNIILCHRRVFVFKVRQNTQKFLIQEGKRVFS
ncbi:MAG: transposase, partial [Selenomonadaceae bacterium]|nr:transposase [Selenomonadaceae bacterium]